MTLLRLCLALPVALALLLPPLPAEAAKKKPQRPTAAQPANAKPKTQEEVALERAHAMAE